MSTQLLLLANSPVLKACNELSAIFRCCYLNPCKIVFNGSLQDKNMSTIEGFNFMYNVYNESHHNKKYGSITDACSGTSTLAHKSINHDFYVQSLKFGICCTENEDLATMPYVNSVKAANQYASYVTVILDIDPYSVNGTEWLKSSLEITHNLKHNTDDELNGYDLCMQARSSVVYDEMTHKFNLFPKMIFVTSVVLLLFMSVSFKSIESTIR